MIDNEEYHESPEPIPPLAEVAAAYYDIEKHNRSYTGVAGAMLNLIHGVAESPTDDPTIDATPKELLRRMAGRIKSRQMEGDASAEMADMFDSGTFAAVGIEVAPFLPDEGIFNEAIYSENDTLVPRITDTDRYMDFLKSLKKGEVQASPATLALPAAVIRTLDDTIRVAYGQLSPNMSEEDLAQIRAAGTDALETFAKLEPEYKRLGLDKPRLYQNPDEPEAGLDSPEATRLSEAARTYTEAYEHLDKCVEYWGRDLLPEYIAIGRELNVGLQTSYFEWNMSEWLTSDVDRILDLQSEDRTREFGAEVARAKFASLTQTLEAMELPKYKDIASEQNRRHIQDQLNRLWPYI